MSEQRVLHFHDASIKGLVAQMNALADNAFEGEVMEHYDIARGEDGQWNAVILIRVRSALPFIRVREVATKYADVSEYPG